MPSEKMTPARWALTAFVVHLGLSFTFMSPSVMKGLLSLPLRAVLSNLIVGRGSGNEAEQAIQATTAYGLAIVLNSLFIAVVVFVVLTMVRRSRVTA